MVQATDFGSPHDRPHLRPLDWPHVWRILLEREVSPRLVIVEKVAGQEASQMAFAQDEDMIQALMSRSAKGFCQGLWGAIRTSAIPMPFTRCRTTWP